MDLKGCIVHISCLHKVKDDVMIWGKHESFGKQKSHRKALKDNKALEVLCLLGKETF